MGEVMTSELRYIGPFNGPIEIGLRALTVLTAAFPAHYSLQRLVVFDYLLVHSDDIPDGPPGLHPKTPHRGGELLVRRDELQQGLLLYQSRSLLVAHYEEAGVYYSATDSSAAFLDVLRTHYVQSLRDRATWLTENFAASSDEDLQEIANKHAGEWGAEFALESILFEDDPA